MARTRLLRDDDVLQAMRDLLASGAPPVTTERIALQLNASTSTVNRIIARLLADGKLAREGRGRASRLRIVQTPAAKPVADLQERASALRDTLRQALGTRQPVTYDRAFVDNYVANVSSLLQPALADELAAHGRMTGQQPAGTYARKVLEQLLIDLSWSSSYLEGNSFSRLDTEELFKSGAAGSDLESVMLLNHKSGIEFLVDVVPQQGLSAGVIRNLHALLMRDLLPDSEQLGAIRQRVVNISGTVYLPSQVPVLLEEMLGRIIEKARAIKNPIEAAFFLWVNVAYLQPFEDGNKRVSRVCANIPLMLYNCAPLSFMDVDRASYTEAMLGVYERCDVALAVELFDSAYRRSIQKYAVILASVGVPDPLRLRFREALNDAIGLIVRDGRSRIDALAALGMTTDSAPGFEALLADELHKLAEFNCARYRLTMQVTRAWIAAGRPG